MESGCKETVVSAAQVSTVVGLAIGDGPPASTAQNMIDGPGRDASVAVPGGAVVGCSRGRGVCFDDAWNTKDWEIAVNCNQTTFLKK